jgi:hypothetical protein
LICGFNGKLDGIVKYHLICCKIDGTDVVRLKYAASKPLEKNWMPFEHDDKLLIVYSLSPHRILQVEDDGNCHSVYLTENSMESFFKCEIGNGTPPVRWNASCYIGIGHIRKKGNRDTIRKTFFYTFSSEPPFEVLACTRPIDFLHEGIEYATGLSVDSTMLQVSLGINDCHGIILSIQRSYIINSLKRLI